MNHPTTRQHLQLVTTHWTDLQQLRNTRPHDPWPPASINTYLRTLEEYDPADGNTPLRLHILDTITAVETALVALADQTAERTQRPTINAAAGQGWTDDLHRQALIIAARDSADPRRWNYRGTRTAPQAAAWLAARIDNAPGPFRPLNDFQRARIADVAEEAAERIARALGTARRTTPTGRTCACGGGIDLHGGDGTAPTLVCSVCQRRVGGRRVAEARWEGPAA